MKIKSIPAALIVAAAVFAGPVGHAQNIGFRVGLAPAIQPTNPIAPFLTPPIAPFLTPPVTAFGTLPPITPPVITTFIGPPHLQFGFFNSPLAPPVQPIAVHRRIGPIGRNVPLGRIAPTPVIIVPTGVIYVQEPLLSQPLPIGLPAPVGMPAPGTLRADVIRQFGSPLATVLTHSGETLHYGGGVIIVLQDGVVVADHPAEPLHR